MSTAELLHYATTYQIPITADQARKITHFLKTNTLNPFKEKDRKLMFIKLEQITDKNTAARAEKLFQELIKEHGVEDWFR